MNDDDDDDDDDDEWKCQLRISKRTFQAIVDKIGPEISKENTRMRDAVPVPKRVAIALWRLTTGNSYHSCGLQFGFGKSTAIEIVDEVTGALNGLSFGIFFLPYVNK